MSLRDQMMKDLGKTEKPSQKKNEAVKSTIKKNKAVDLNRISTEDFESTKEVRHQVYDYIEKNVGPLEQRQRAEISQLLKKLAATANLYLTSQCNGQQIKINQLKKQIESRKRK